MGEQLHELRLGKARTKVIAMFPRPKKIFSKGPEQIISGEGK